MTRPDSLAFIGACAAAASLFLTADARACGGCFVPPTDSTIVTGHRMALSVSTTQTVLWDQIQYSGDPAEFAWVLPVKPGAVIEVSTDAWFETLEAATAVQVVQPQIECHQPFSFNCGGSLLADRSDVSASEGDPGFGPQVDVLHRGTVGPYETVTLSTETPGALNEWLTKASFAVDPATQPIIDAYVDEGFDFIALKLKGDADVREMKPVRVVTPGASPTLPLRMVAVGSGPEVAITLFVIAEGRLAASNFANAGVPLDLLAWDFKEGTSNYGELREKTLRSTTGGAAWLTTYAQQGALLGPINNRFSMGTIQYGTSVNGQFLDSIGEAYLNQSVVNKEAGIEGVPTDVMGCSLLLTDLGFELAQSSAAVVDSCPEGASPDDPSCAPLGSGELDASLLACGAADDLAVALIGSHPKDVWLTRLEAALPQAALATDLELAPADRQEPVENWVQARVAVNAETQCPQSVSPPVVWSDRSGKPPTGALVGIWAVGLALAAAAARRLSRPAWATVSFGDGRRR